MKIFYIPTALLFLFGSFLQSKAQLVVESAFTPIELVQDILLGQGVLVSNITYQGADSQFGYFDSQNSNVGIETGVILTNGDVNIAVGPNNNGAAWAGLGGSGDADLTQLSGVSTYDAVILEFDFVPGGDTIEFDYVFASEEYNEFVCAFVNDAFGFFLSGPGISGPFTNSAVNIATVPGGDIPVSINTVNLGWAGLGGNPVNCLNIDPNFDQNNIYFVDNEGNSDPTAIQYDGLTVELTAFAEVIPDSTYHIKIALADGGDYAYDSGVFLRTASLYSASQNPVGIETIESKKIRAFPQPATQTVSFGIQGNDWSVRIINLAGQTKMERSLMTNSISIEELNSGIYTAVLQNSRTGEVGFSKLIIQ